MKVKFLLLAFSIITVFFLSSENANAACPTCPAGYCSAGTYLGTCENLAGCTSCNTNNFCDGDKVSSYYVETCGYDIPNGRDFYAQCKLPLITCSAPNPKCYQSGSSASCVQCLSDADCTSPKKCDLSTHKCESPPPLPCTSCIDGTLKDACNANGEKCKDLLNNGVCTLQADPTCVGCVATLNLNQQGTTNPCTLKPSVSASGCAEGSDFEIRLGSTAACSGKISAGAGSCSQWTIVSSTTYDLWLNDNGWKKKDTKTADCWGGGGGGGCNNNGVQDNGETGVDCGGGGCDACISCPGSCGYISAWTGFCSTGCPISYPNQQWTCVPGLPGGCGGRSGCASYDPTKGETPCSPSCGSFSICDKQSVCTSNGCKNICTDPTYPKSGDTYCSKCNSCQDGIQNCGEPTVDKCGEPCTVSQTTEYVKWSPSYCWQVCANDGATCVGVMGSSGQYYPQGCSQGWTGNCKCSKTTTDFNPKTILESNL